MIDTVVLRFHNIKKYKSLYEQYQMANKKKNTAMDCFVSVSEDGEVTERTRILQRGKIFEDRSKFVPFNMRFDMRSASSVYHVRGYFRNMDSDETFLEIELSFPKFYYATNVFQILGIPAQGAEPNFHMLLKCIRRFQEIMFNQIVKHEDIEIFRLDMCYNQFFESKKDAMFYLGEQKRHMQDYARHQNMRYVDSGETTWTILTQRYSFKCYHKGTEFAKNDAKELAGNLEKHNYNVGQIQAIADRILRYEITYRNGMLNYLMMHYTFHSMGTRPWLEGQNLYKYIMRMNKWGTVTKHNSLNNITKIGGSVLENFSNKMKQFRLKSPFDGAFNPSLIECRQVTFNYPCYRLLYGFFWTKVKAAQLKTGMPMADLVKKVQEYQERCAKRKAVGLVPKGKVKRGSTAMAGGKNTARLIVPLALSQYQDIRTLRKYLPSATYKRLMSDIRKMGVPMKNGFLDIKMGKLDYSDNVMYCVPLLKKFLI